MALRVGITGGIGSGKTVVCNLFALLGVPIYFADDKAKEILQTDTEVIEAVKKLLGNNVYTNEGKLDRKLVATLVFPNPDLLAQYNAIVHPAVFKDANAWMDAHTEFPYVIKEAALLFESGAYQELDKIICVTAPEQLRIERVMQRDKVSALDVRMRMQNQWTEEEKILHSDFIIINNGQSMLIPQVLEMHKQLQSQSAIH